MVTTIITKRDKLQSILEITDEPNICHIIVHLDSTIRLRTVLDKKPRPKPNTRIIVLRYVGIPEQKLIAVINGMACEAFAG